MTETESQAGGIKSRIKEKTAGKNRVEHTAAEKGAPVTPVKEWNGVGKQAKNQTLLRIWSVI